MSFLKDYLFFCQNSEAHEYYHLWTAMTVLSSAIGKRVWLDQQYFEISTNLFVVLVGEPGNRKTSAMDLGKAMMKEVGEQGNRKTSAMDLGKAMMKEVGDIPFSAEKQSTEGLTQSMSEQETAFTYKGKTITYSPMTICATELKEFLSVSGGSMINFLTTIYDRKFYDYKTRNKEDITINNPFLNIIACETPEWITIHLRDDVISGGFSRRVLFANVTQAHKRIARPSISPDQRAAWKRCVDRCKALKSVAGEFQFNEESIKFYDNWYENIKIPHGSILVGYYESKHIMVLKVSMLIALSEGNELILKKEFIITAIELLEELEKTLEVVFVGMGRNQLNVVRAAMLDFLEKVKGPITEKELLQVMFRHANYMELIQVIQHISNSPDVVRYKSGPTGGLEKVYICLRKWATPELLRSLERVTESKPDSSVANGRSSVQPTSGQDVFDLLRGSQPVVPGSSAAQVFQPPTPVG